MQATGGIDHAIAVISTERQMGFHSLRLLDAPRTLAPCSTPERFISRHKPIIYRKYFTHWGHQRKKQQVTS